MAEKIDPTELIENFDFGNFCFDGATNLPCDHCNFEKVSGIGTGNFSTVSQYLHKETGSRLALKKQRFSIEEHPKMDRVIGLEEIKLLQKTSECRHIVNFYGAYIHEGHIYIGEELMHDSMDQVLIRAARTETSLPEGLLRKIGLSVCLGLKFLLDINYMHRDIKPSNILMNHLGEFKLCDMGIAGDLAKGVDTQIGSKLYLPPERLTINPSAYTYTSDIWAFGMTLLELALGRHPYMKGHVAPSIFDIYQLASGNPPLPPTSRSMELQQLISVCLVKDPKDRPSYDGLLKTEFLAVAEDSFDVMEWYTAFSVEK